VVGALSLADCTVIILNHKVTCNGKDKEREKINPSSATREAKTDISAMY